MLQLVPEDRSSLIKVMMSGLAKISLFTNVVLLSHQCTLILESVSIQAAVLLFAMSTLEWLVSSSESLLEIEN